MLATTAILEAITITSHVVPSLLESAVYFVVEVDECHQGNKSSEDDSQVVNVVNGVVVSQAEFSWDNH